MSFLQKIEGDLKDAMKSKDSFRLGVLRLIKSELKNKEIELIRPVTETEFIAVLSRMVNQRKDSIEQYKKGGREDLAQNEANELQVINAYLPKALSEDEVKQIIAEAKQKVGAQGPKDMGLVMKEIKDKTAGRFDGKQIADLVKAALAGAWTIFKNFV